MRISYSSKQLTDEQAAGVEAEAENGVCHETLQSRGAGPRRAARGDAGAHGGLHDEERCGDGDDADQQRRPQAGTLEPCPANHREQQASERDTNQVMRGPSDYTFSTNGGDGRDGHVAKSSARETADPAAYELVIREGRSEQLPPQQRPQVRSEERRVGKG